MAYESIDCIDAGTEYCPCYLAETNDCIICSQLQGKEFCDCINWKGVCIYQEYIWNSSKKEDIRKGYSADILEKKLINDNALYLKLKVTRTLSRELNHPGAYIFLKSESHPYFFDVPMSIMDSDEINETIDLLIEIIGAKTKVISKIDDKLIVRGPYWNGVLGIKNLKAVKNSDCLIIARGVSQAPAVIVAKKLCFSGNRVTVLLDPGKSNTDISREYFESMGCTVLDTKLLDGRKLDDEASKQIRNIIGEKNMKFIFSSGSDLLHKGIINIKNDIDKSILFSCTNNSNICCGEGICGSCIVRLNDNRKIKSCKAQVSPEDLFGEG